MIIAGRVSQKMAPVIRQLYSRCLSPSGSSPWAPARPPAASSTTTRMVQGVNQWIPVDVYVPGCPPRPEQLIYAIMLLQEKIKNEHGSFKRALNIQGVTQVIHRVILFRHVLRRPWPE